MFHKGLIGFSVESILWFCLFVAFHHLNPQVLIVLLEVAYQTPSLIRPECPPLLTEVVKAEANQSNISSNTLDEKLDECLMNVG